MNMLRCSHVLIHANVKYQAGLSLKPPNIEHIFIAVITSPTPPPPPPPFFCADTFDINLLLIVCALR